MAFLTDRTLTTGVTVNDLIHIVITGDTSQNPAGSSYKATMGQVLDLINPTTLTGGTYDPLTGTITFYDDIGGSFNVTGLVTGYTNTAVTGLTYNNANTFTILENDGTTHSASFNIVTGLTINALLDGLSIKNGTGNADNVSNLIEGINASNVKTSIIRADGAISGSSLYVSGTTGYNQLIVKTTYTPSGTTDTNGVLGDISWDASYVYVKTAAGWKRSGLTTW